MCMMIQQLDLHDHSRVTADLSEQLRQGRRGDKQVQSNKHLHTVGMPLQAEVEAAQAVP